MSNMVDLDDLIVASDISKLLGVSAPTVSNWQNRHEDFPKPINTAGRYVFFSKKEVVKWWCSRHEELTAAIIQYNKEN